MALIKCGGKSAPREITLYDGNKIRTNISLNGYHVNDFDHFIVYTQANAPSDSWVNTYTVGTDTNIQHYVVSGGINYCMTCTITDGDTSLNTAYTETNQNMGLGITKVIGVML